MPKKKKAPLPEAPKLIAEAWGRLESLVGDKLTMEQFKVVAAVAFLGIQHKAGMEFFKAGKDVYDHDTFIQVAGEAYKVLDSYESAESIFLDTFNKHPDLVLKILAALLGYTLKKRSKDFLERRDELDSALYIADKNNTDPNIAGLAGRLEPTGAGFSDQQTKMRRRRRDKAVRDYANAEKAEAAREAARLKAEIAKMARLKDAAKGTKMGRWRPQERP